MEKILVSACLLGNPVRYNGTDLLQEHEVLQGWVNEGRVIPVCPEVAGGMPVPRAPAEIVGGPAGAVLSGNASVIDNSGTAVTAEFVAGAEKALALCKQHQIKIAILTESSPSCGCTRVHDGSFSGVKIAGEGVTSALLRQHGVQVFSQYSISDAAQCLREIGSD